MAEKILFNYDEVKRHFGIMSDEIAQARSDAQLYKEQMELAYRKTGLKFMGTMTEVSNKLLDDITALGRDMDGADMVTRRYANAVTEYEMDTTGLKGGE